MASTGALAASVCPFPLDAQIASQTPFGWIGYTGEGDNRGSAGNTEDVLDDAHAAPQASYWIRS